MTRSQIESAIRREVPFKLRMADGNEYDVPHPDYISLSPKGTFVTVYDDQEHFFVLPLLGACLKKGTTHLWAGRRCLRRCSSVTDRRGYAPSSRLGANAAALQIWAVSFFRQALKMTGLASTHSQSKGDPQEQ